MINELLRWLSFEVLWFKYKREYRKHFKKHMSFDEYMLMQYDE